MPAVRANGIELHYERFGSGPPRLWLNGSGSTTAQVAPLLRPFLCTSPGGGGGSSYPLHELPSLKDAERARVHRPSTS